ncbi:MAG: 2-C-methyl-D-erythritol 4-phosphate cytidylyltransferase, partial [Candidatus Omnitrophica bacterium]|nr:2-C-methyl-D-erythritol 4-phosphate cytidylyltransferase [Candidatus Omnitrophota bacterium]
SDYEELFKEKIKSFNFKKVKAVIKGGLTRQESVRRALINLSYDSEWVLIHDGVRPFINLKLISKVIQEAKKGEGAVLGIPIDSTVKRIKENKNRLFIERTVKRDKLWQIQTPQVFKKELILEAHRRFKDRSFTDDAVLLEKLGYKIAVVEGSYFNIKITYPQDLVLAKYILRLKKIYGI